MKEAVLGLIKDTRSLREMEYLIKMLEYLNLKIWGYEGNIQDRA